MALFRDLTPWETILWLSVCLISTIGFGYALYNWEMLPGRGNNRWFLGAMIAFVIMWRSATRLGGGLAYPMGAALTYTVTHDPVTMALVYPVLALVYKYGTVSTESRRRAINLYSIDSMENQLIERHNLKLGQGFSTGTLRVRDLCPDCRRKAYRNLETIHNAAYLGIPSPDPLPTGTCTCWEPLRSPVPSPLE